MSGFYMQLNDLIQDSVEVAGLASHNFNNILLIILMTISFYNIFQDD